MQPLRDETDDIIEVLSGKRTQELNEAVKGSENSDHLFRSFYSCATDFVVYALINNPSVWTVEKIVRLFTEKGGFKQLIWYPNNNFFHFAPFGLTPKESQILVR